jgi:diaminopimelate epimerase
MEINLTYMSGAGNTFTVVDNREYQYPADYWSALAYLLCSSNSYNKFATEGLLVINESEKHDFEVFFFNPDGSQGMMCGNGGRCAVFFAGHENFISSNKKNVQFKMAGNIYKADFAGDNIRVYFPAPVSLTENVKIKLPDTSYSGTLINVNSDHYCIDYDTIKDVLQVQNFRDFCIDKLAPGIRFHNYFQPRGVNVNIYKIDNRNLIQLRTYERGVEAETGACGTGALSTAISAYKKQLIDLPVEIIPPSLSPLKVEFEFENNEIIELILEGKAEIKSKSKVILPDYFSKK